MTASFQERPGLRGGRARCVQEQAHPSNSRLPYQDCGIYFAVRGRSGWFPIACHGLSDRVGVRAGRVRECRVRIQLPEVERRVGWPELFSMARTAEGVGFDSLWVGDHLLYDLPGGVARGPWEAWTALAALAAATERVELGPLVASTSFHAPAMLAKQAATVDAISGGRLILGLGAGWNEREYRAFGFPYDHRVSRFEEAFTIIRRLLRGGRVDFDGAYYRAEDCVLDPGPARPGGPPLMLGSTSPRMMRI